MAKQNRYIGDTACGVLPLIKDSGMTSHDAVFAVRRLYSTARVGHTGTLDPMASGVLIILVGRSAKAAEYILHDRKRYIATLRLGIETDTEDICGSVTAQHDIPSEPDIPDIIRHFTGEQKQIPPMYSAIKVGGQKLLDLARQGITVEREPRDITVFSLDISRTGRPDELLLDVSCSGGTYIRTLCADIGSYLGCGGCMASLRRVENSGFSEKDCVTLTQLESMTEEERLSLLRPTESLFANLPALTPNEFYARLLRSGCTVLTKKLGADRSFSDTVGARLRLCDDRGFFSLGEIVQTDDGTAVKPIKKFRLD